MTSLRLFDKPFTYEEWAEVEKVLTLFQARNMEEMKSKIVGYKAPELN